MARLPVSCVALSLALLAVPRPAAAQAFLPGMGSVTFLVQGMDHNGRMNNDGHREMVPKRTVNVAIAVDVDYALTDRWLMSFTVPYILSKFTDKMPANGGLPPKDACRCLIHEFADFGFSTHYNAINIDEVFVLTPFVSAGVPSHSYEYVGEAVVGRRLRELRLGVDAAQRLDGLIRHLGVQASYGYTFVEHDDLVPGISYNRSNGTAVLGYPVRRWLFTRAIAAWQITHGGLRFPCEIFSSDDPLKRGASQLAAAQCRNAVNPPERPTEFHRMLRDNYLHVGAGLTYALGAWDVSGEFVRTALGSNSHDVHVLSITVGRSFELRHP